MFNSIKIIRKQEQTTSQWSGGKTTQLAIYPEDADYAKRNFQWRISSADIEVEESLFTHLPGIQRVLMVLEGEMSLQHEGQHSVLLKPFEQDRFDGGWTTRSQGRVKDFNLMLAEGCRGELQAIHIRQGIQHQVLGSMDSRGFEAYYCANGTVRTVIDESEAIILGKGDIMILDTKKVCKTIDTKLYNQGELTATIVRASIIY